MFMSITCECFVALLILLCFACVCLLFSSSMLFPCLCDVFDLCVIIILMLFVLGGVLFCVDVCLLLFCVVV